MFKKCTSLLAGAAVAVGMATAPAMAADKEMTIGWTPWSDAEFVTKLAKKILEERMDYNVELKQTSIAPQYQGVAGGSIDAMLMSWLPGTHADYMDKTEADTINLGMLYGNAALGWAVPAYVPKDKVNSISDLKKDEVREKLDGEIQGIDPGAGLMRLSKKAVNEDYNLDYNLLEASGSAMTAALKRAIQRDEWIVVTGWRPHWMNQAFDIRYLEDPKGSLGKAERIHAIAREGFYQDNVHAGIMLARMYIPMDELEGAMAYAQENSYEKAVDRYIKNHQDRVDYWVTGDMPK